MTCEVAVMNTHGVALAADSAVSSSDGHKVYQTAEKLFPLSPAAPIGIMTYGCADLMGVPWETVIKMFTRDFADRRWDHVEQYAHELLRYIEASDSLFPASAQRRWLRSTVGEYWRHVFLDPLKKKLGDDADGTAKRQAPEILSDLIQAHLKDWEGGPLIEELGVTYGERVVAEYSFEIDEAEKTVFESFELSPQLRHALREIVVFMYTKKWIHPGDFSGLVVAGMGEAEAFPTLVHYDVGTVASDKLRYFKTKNAQVSTVYDAWILPFAQTEMIDMFLKGIYPEVEEILAGSIVQSLTKLEPLEDKQKITETVEKAIREALNHEARKKYTEPLMTAVSGLPRYDLATFAEALVNLTALRKRMDVAEHESVGGPVDVAVISKGDGFVWVKRKDLVRGSVSSSVPLA
jgi:hypothetical protein